MPWADRDQLFPEAPDLVARAQGRDKPHAAHFFGQRSRFYISPTGSLSEARYYRMMNAEGYEPDSFDGLLTALLQSGDQAARMAMGEYLRMRTSGITPVIERHPQRGWRVRPLDQDPLNLRDS